MSTTDYWKHPTGAGSESWMRDLTPPAASDVAVGDVAVIACWFRTTVSQTQSTITGTRGDAGAKTGLDLNISAAEVYRILSDSGSFNVSAEWGSLPAYGVWHHMVGWVNRTAGTVDGWAANTMYLSIDNGTPVSAAASDSHLTYTAQSLGVGARDNGVAGFQGDVMIAEMYKDLPTSTEIGGAYAAGIGSSFASVLSNAVYVVEGSALSGANLPVLPASYTDPQGNGWTIGANILGQAKIRPETRAREFVSAQQSHINYQ